MKTVTVSDEIKNYKLWLGTSKSYICNLLNLFINNNRKLIVFCRRTLCVNMI